MDRIIVHDFYFEDFEIDNKNGEKDFCYSVNVYYNFSPDDPGDGWDNLALLNITVATPSGLAKYLNRCLIKGIYPDIFFFSHTLFSERNDRDKIKAAIKKELESLTGPSKNSLIAKALRKFDGKIEDQEISGNNLN
jgi:hypothetical protein